MLAAAQLPASEASPQARNPHLGDFCPAVNDNVKEISSLGSESRWGTENLDYMHARYYNPLLGRFLSVDPAEESALPTLPQSWNRYAYVRNNPINYNDPTGRFAAAVAATFFNLCYNQGLCSDEIITVTASYDYCTGVQGLGELEAGAYGGFGYSLLASIQALPSRLVDLDAIGKEAFGANYSYQQLMEYDSFDECIEAGVCKMGMMPIGPGGIGGKKVGDLISGSLKRSARPC